MKPVAGYCKGVDKANDSSGSLMNFGLVDVNKIEKPKRGDMAMHNGTGFADKEARLALYDGLKWVFFKPDTAPTK